MARKKIQSDLARNLEVLRRKAESRLQGAPKTTSRLAPELGRLVHELEVHRAELEIQNEELQSARNETEASLARYTALFDFAPIGYATLSEDRSIREINHAGVRLLGLERGFIVGKKFDLFVPARELWSWENLIRAAFRGERSESADIELRRVQVRFFARVSAVTLEQTGRIVLLAFEDISQHRQREQQLVNAERALRESDRRKNEFLAVLSHELRNPLAPIRSSLFLLTRAEAGDEKARRAHAIIERQVTHLTRLVDDLLDVTRIARSKIQLQRERLDLSELVRRTIEDHRTNFEAAGLNLKLELEPGPFWVDADPARLVQIVSNLLGNAEKFTPREGTVTVRLRRVGAGFELRVSDTGAGIAPEVLERLFEPFAQAPQTMERTRGGLGLGLAMVKGLVELHKGTVTITSEGLGCGTELTIVLPAAEAPSETADEPAPPASVRRRVLIIEDNVDASDSLKEALQFSGHEVRNAYDGPSGLEMAKTFCPDVVICDIGLPLMDGYEVARAFRADFGLSDTYLIALSGYAQPEDKQRASEAGFDRHIAKPPSMDRLNRILSEGRGAQTPSAPVNCLH
jgi:two-component system CheB/CheR fusion protein